MTALGQNQYKQKYESARTKSSIQTKIWERSDKILNTNKNDSAWTKSSIQTKIIDDLCKQWDSNCKLCFMYIINKFQFYFFCFQLNEVNFGLPMFLNYMYDPPSPILWHNWEYTVYVTTWLSHYNSSKQYLKIWARGGAAGWGTALQVRRSRVWFPMVSLEFFIDTILLAALWPWGWLSL